MDLRHLDFGRDTAEFDKHLREYFLETLTYDRMIRGEKSLLIGRKGTGKTALVKYATENENTASQYIIKIEATHSTYVKIDENLRSFTTQVKNLDSSFKLGWLFATLVALIDRLSRETSMYVTKDETRVYEFAKNELGYDESDPISAIAGYVFSWIKHLKSIGPIERNVADAPVERIFDEPRVLELIRSALARVTAKGKSVYLLFDKLDERWDGSALYVSFLQGLFLAIKDIKATTTSVYPVVLLRDDIFDHATMDFQHIDHYRMEIEPIAWNESGLLDLVARRIEASLSKQAQKVQHLSSQDLWDLAFPEKLPARGNPQAAYTYMIERTLLRPRDIILFCNLARDAAMKAKRPHVAPDDIRSAEVTYSQMKLRDLVAEMSYRFPGLEPFLLYFRRRTIGYEAEELKVHLLEAATEISSPSAWMQQGPDELLKILYSMGFFSFIRQGGVLRGNRVIHSAIDSDPGVILEQKRIHVSPIFRKALELRDH